MSEKENITSVPERRTRKDNGGRRFRNCLPNLFLKGSKK